MLMDILLFPFKVVFGAVGLVFKVVGGVISAVFGVVGGLMSFVISAAVVLGIIGLIVSVCQRHKSSDTKDAPAQDEFISYYDKNAVK